MTSPASQTIPVPKVGASYALAAYLSWGLLPAYWKLLQGIDVSEILAHRIVWSAGFVTLVLAIRGRVRQFGDVVRHPHTMLALAVTGCLLVLNWIVYLWAVTNEHVLEASLGYFVNPLMIVALGTLILHEKLRKLQWTAITIAGIGVANLAWHTGGLPWIALGLAGTFSLYGLVRKVVLAKPLVGTGIEMLLIAPLAAGYLLWRASHSDLAFGSIGASGSGLLALTGAVTALPLIWFSGAAKNLTYSVLGVFQFLSPTSQFLLATLAYEEPVSAAHGVTFALIWLALTLYVIDAYRTARRSRRAA